MYNVQPKRMATPPKVQVLFEKDAICIFAPERLAVRQRPTGSTRADNCADRGTGPRLAGKRSGARGRFVTALPLPPTSRYRIGLDPEAYPASERSRSAKSTRYSFQDPLLERNERGFSRYQRRYEPTQTPSVPRFATPPHSFPAAPRLNPDGIRPRPEIPDRAL